MTPLDEHWTTTRQDSNFDTSQGETVKTLGHALLEWLAAQPYPANDTEFIRDLIDKARELTK